MFGLDDPDHYRDELTRLEKESADNECRLRARISELLDGLGDVYAMLFAKAPIEAVLEHICTVLAPIQPLAVGELARKRQAAVRAWENAVRLRAEAQAVEKEAERLEAAAQLESARLGTLQR